MAEIGLYDLDGARTPPAQRVKEAREAGMSYGCYMAKLYEREVKERARKSENRTNRAGPDAAADG